jgi:hypothetical protein
MQENCRNWLRLKHEIFSWAPIRKSGYHFNSGNHCFHSPGWSTSECICCWLNRLLKDVRVSLILFISSKCLPTAPESAVRSVPARSTSQIYHPVFTNSLWKYVLQVNIKQLFTFWLRFNFFNPKYGDSVASRRISIEVC